MVRTDRITESDSEALSLWLVIRCGSETFAFEFEADSARIVTVGTAAHSDVRLDVPEAGSLVCYFERDAEKLWLVPGYHCKQLRADATLVDRPRRLSWRSIVEYAGVEFEVRVRDEPPTSSLYRLTDGDTGGSGGATGKTGRSTGTSAVSLDDDLDDLDEDYPTIVSVPKSQRVKSLGSRQALSSNIELRPADDCLLVSPSVLSERRVQKIALRPVTALGELARRRPFVVALWISLCLVASVLVTSIVRKTPSTAAPKGKSVPPPK